jgi:metal-dependent amidase/aminoacylase/carboxypeptidase family protein
MSLLCTRRETRALLVDDVPLALGNRQETLHENDNTVPGIHGGTKHNIIPNEVKLELTTRGFSDTSRQIVVEGIRRIAQGVAVSAGVPDNLAPIVTVLDAESTPVMYNDPALTARVKSALVQSLGAQNVFDEDPIMGSEDFGVLGLEGRKIPTVMFWLGAVDPAPALPRCRRLRSPC